MTDFTVKNGLILDEDRRLLAWRMSDFGTSVKRLCKGLMLAIVRGGADVDICVNRVVQK